MANGKSVSIKKGNSYTATGYNMDRCYVRICREQLRPARGK